MAKILALLVWGQLSELAVFPVAIQDGLPARLLTKLFQNDNF
jgi:hypothetical protein